MLLGPRSALIPWKRASQQSCGPKSDGTPGADERAKAEVGAILTWGGVVHSLCVCHTHMLTSATNDGPQH